MSNKNDKDGKGDWFAKFVRTMLAMAIVFTLIMCYTVVDKDLTQDSIEALFNQAIEEQAEVPYVEFLKMVEEELVDTVYYNTNNEKMCFTLYTEETKAIPYDQRVDYIYDIENYKVTMYPSGEEFREKLLSAGVRVVLIRERSNVIISTILSILPSLVLLSAYVWFLWAMTRKQIGNFDEKELIQTSDVKFEQIIGLEEITNELHTIVETIKDPSYGSELGIKPSKGILLSGPPGVGKTLIAKAIACEASIPFLSLSGSDFKELYVGNGARRVRSAFKAARKNAPCIVFIDEIDAVAASRDTAIQGNSEDSQTINALLKEMDGFTGREGIFVLAATNHPENLDSALKRSGRFDREVVIPPPKDWHVRKEMFEYYLKDKPLSDDVDLDTLSRCVAGFTGADIATVCNEAGLIALYNDKKYISHADLEEAVDKKVFKGNRSSKKQNVKDVTVVAYHEAGHAVVSLLCNLPVSRASIIPTTSGVGGAVFREDSDSFFETEKSIWSQILVSYAGRASEQIKFNEITTGAQNDIQQATSLLIDYVGSYGFDVNDSGMIAMNASVHQINNEKFISDRVRFLSKKAYNECMELLTKNYKMVEDLAERLLEVESMTGKEITEFLSIE